MSRRRAHTRRGAPSTDPAVTSSAASTRARNKQRAGAAWEQRIDSWNIAYLRTRTAFVTHHGPPMTMLEQPRDQIVRVKVTGVGPPDYGGLVVAHLGARSLALSVLFEAKRTGERRWAFENMKKHQAEQLGAQLEMGGVSFVALCTKEAAWVLPWEGLSPLWTDWYRATLMRKKGERLPRGTASISAAECDSIGERMSPAGNWLPAVRSLGMLDL